MCCLAAQNRPRPIWLAQGFQNHFTDVNNSQTLGRNIPDFNSSQTILILVAHSKFIRSSQIHQKIIYRGMGRQHHWTDFGINFWLWQVMFYLCGVLAGNPSRVLFWHWLKCGERSGVSRPRQTRDVNLWHHSDCCVIGIAVPNQIIQHTAQIILWKGVVCSLVWRKYCEY